MKAYVIKNKEGKYLDDCGFFTHWVKDIYLYEYYEDADKSIKFYNLTDCSIVPITIYEGDPLKLACEELKCRDENKTQAKLVIQQIKNKWLGENVGYKDWFIKQAKESKRNE